MPRLRIVMPVNSKMGVYREVVSYPSTVATPTATMQFIATFFAHYGAYVEIWNPILELWVEITEEMQNVRIPAPTN